MTKKAFIIVLVLVFPTIALLFRPGIYTMHDFHVFRIQQFDKCVRSGIFPCRWAADMGLGYGEPLFNFYGQFTYWLSAVPRLLGASILDSYKIVAGLSVIGSVGAMFVLAKKLWGPKGAIISSVFYAYAPYRAVDLWVRGAIPESLSFIFFPLILLFLYEFNFVGLTLSLALLIITHNLSVLIFAPFAAIWWIFWLVKNKQYQHILPTFVSGLVALALSAFYLFPVAVESPLVSVATTTESYYQFAHHFVSLYQLFVTNFWGYGGSIWGPNDGMSFSVGHIHWIIAALLLIGVILSKRSAPKDRLLVMLTFALGLFAAFLTHGKSEFIWKHVPGLPYIQFPWRYLTMSTLFFSLASGAITTLTKNRFVLIFLINLIILVNFNFFRPDIWHQVTDQQHFSGDSWDQQRSASVSDFWPKSAPLPNDFAPDWPRPYQSPLETDREVTFPVVYFPGWTSLLDGRQYQVHPDPVFGLVTANLPAGTHTFELRFIDTWPRLLGNIVSAVSLLGLVSFSIFKYAKK